MDGRPSLAILRRVKPGSLRLLRRILAFWPLLLALGWFASTTRLAGHLHAIHERAPHLDDAAGDWAGECDLCRSVVTQSTGFAALKALPVAPEAIAAAALPLALAPRVLHAEFPPLAPRPPPARA